MRSTARNVALLAADSFDDVLEIVQLARASLNEILSACEFFDRESLDLQLSQRLPSVSDPFQSPHPMYARFYRTSLISSAPMHETAIPHHQVRSD